MKQYSFLHHDNQSLLWTKCANTMMMPHHQQQQQENHSLFQQCMIRFHEEQCHGPFQSIQELFHYNCQALNYYKYVAMTSPSPMQSQSLVVHSSTPSSSTPSQSSRFEQYAAEYHRLLNPPVPSSLPFTSQQEKKIEDMDAVLQRQLMARRIDDAKWAPQMANGEPRTTPKLPMILSSSPLSSSIPSSTTPSSSSPVQQLALPYSNPSQLSLTKKPIKPPRLCITDDDDLPSSSIIILLPDQDIGLTRKHISWEEKESVQEK